MKIFISYGHDFVNEVKKIAESFKSIGHEVWIDYERIQPGDDWRDSITEGILSADVTLALLSEYGLREGGVCLDELAVAVSCNRRNIRPAIMDKGALARVPACISGIQYFDLSDWRDIPETEFDEWYENKFDTLVDLYLKKPSVYEEKLRSIKNKMHLSLQFSRELFELGKGFKKRDWLDDEIEKWVNGDFGNVCLLVGFPGFGKSCYCTNYYHYGDDVAGLVFCDADEGKYQGVVSAIKEVSFGLAVRIPSFATRLERILCDPDVNLDTTPEKLFELLIMEPLNLIDIPEEKTVVLIDAVDILSENGENRLSKLFLSNAKRLPSYVKIMLSCRSDASLLGGATDVYKISPAADDENVFDDIKEYVINDVSAIYGDDADKIGVTVAEKAQGSFLYASAVSDGLKAGKFSMEADELPEKVSDVYYGWMNRIVTPAEYEEKYSEAISVLSAIENPPIDFIKKVMGWKQQETLSFVRKFSVLLQRYVDKFGKTCVSFYSKSFADWVKNEEKSAAYFASDEEGFSVIASYIRGAYDEEELSDYDYMIAVDVLKKAGKKKVMRTLASDDDFFTESLKLVAKLERDAEFYPEWTGVLDGLSYLLDEYGLDDDKRRRIAYFRAKGEFACGDLLRSKKIFDENETLFESGPHDEEYLDYLYMYGTVCDFVGERNKSFEKFSALSMYASGKNSEFEVKGIAGLIWNGHFNAVDESLKLLERLDKIVVDDELSTMKDLLSARTLLSAGKLQEALARFDAVLDTNFDKLWSCDVVARKNQMLAIEAIVSAYDAGDYNLAVKYGEKILSRLENSGSLSECYCLSWLALAERKAKHKDKANEYLGRAKEILGMGDETSSKWLKMHLTSIEGGFLSDSGDLRGSLRLYTEVENLAKECDDAWVRGDACFDIISTSFILGDEIDEYYKLTLSSLADKTALPHLIYKKRIMRIITGEEILDEYEEVPALASVDVKKIALLLYEKNKTLPFAEKYKELAEI